MSGRRSIRALAFVLLTVATAGHAFAEDLSIQAFLDPAQGFNDQTPFRLVILIEGTETPQVVPPRLPPLENLTVISGPNAKTNISWINGRTTSSYEISYTLLPGGPGSAKIPALELRVGARVHRTEPFLLQVTKAAGGRPGPAAPGPGGQPESDETAVFLEAKLGAEEIWVGQSVPLTVTLYTLPRVSGFVWRQQPDFASFWVESVDFDSDADAFRTRIGSRVYTAYPVDRRVLIAPGPGMYTIDPYVGQVQVHVARDDPFDWFRFGRSETILRKSEPLALTVRPLPEAGKPEGFSGAVGRYDLQVTLDRDEALVDDAVALKATVFGEGALRSIGPPRIDAPSDVKVFDPQVKESIVRTRGDRIESRKTWEWIFVPLKPGDVRVPALTFDYFDPQTGTYRAATSTPLRLAVRRGEAGTDMPVARGPVQVRRDLAFIKALQGPLRESHPRVHDRAWFRVLLLAPLALTPLLIVLGRQRSRLRLDQGLARSRRARSRARRRLQAARRRLGHGETAAIHEEVARTLVEYLADRTNRSAAGLTYETAEELLAARGIDPEVRRRFRACLERCDFVRFVPEARGDRQQTEVLAEADALIEALERAR